jgi:alpha-D-xyloside xylohydrolase
MFGQSLLVAPVTEPGVATQKVYLPKSSGWFDFWTGEKFDGGQSIQVDVLVDKIPVFVKAGAIIPMSKPIQHTKELSKDTINIRVYHGADGDFVLYEDEGDNYKYERGAYSEIGLRWDDANKILTIEDRKGAFDGMPEVHVFNIIWMNGLKSELAEYRGKRMEIASKTSSK